VFLLLYYLVQSWKQVSNVILKQGEYIVYTFIKFINIHDPRTIENHYLPCGQRQFFPASARRVITTMMAASEYMVQTFVSCINFTLKHLGQIKFYFRFFSSKWEHSSWHFINNAIFATDLHEIENISLSAGCFKTL